MRLHEDHDHPCPPPAPHSLVLFVGAGMRPGPELCESLARAGVRGLWLATPAQALAAAAHARFDAAVVQVEAPMAAAARHFDDWRQTLCCPLLVVSELDDEVDEIIALELGADAVLPRSAAPRLVRAHLLMLLRRGQAGDAQAPAPPPSAAEATGWQLDRVHNRLCRDGRQVQFTELQAVLMQVLLENLGRVVPRARLLAAAAGGRVLQTRSVDVYMARLRRRLRQERVDELQLEGIRGRGYLLRSVAAERPGWPSSQSGVLHWIAAAAP